MSSDATMMLLVCNCGQKMKVSTASHGKTVRCVKCGERIVVSQENTRQIPTDVVAASSEHAGKATAAGGDTAHQRTGSASAPSHPSGAPDAAVSHETARIGALLVEHGLVTEAQVQEALAVQQERGGKTFELLIELGYLDKKNLHSFFSKQPGIASIDLSNYHVDSELASLIPKEFALDRVILPIDKLGKLLTVGMACPIDTVTIKAVEAMTGLRVKAMLCRLDDIHAAVQKCYRDPNAPEIDATLESFGLAKTPAKAEEPAPQLAQLNSLPAAPETLARIREKGESITVEEAAHIVAEDPPFAISVLALANSSAYGFHGRVDSLGMALALLGTYALRQVALAAEFAAKSVPAEAVDTRLLRTRSRYCAVAAQRIAALTQPSKIAVAYTAGLTHEIGRFAFAALMPARYAKLDPGLTGAELGRMEKQTFGLAHPEAGYSVASRWGLPATLLEPIRRHHEPDKASDAKDIVDIVAVASTLADTMERGSANAADPYGDCADSLRRLGLEKAAVQRVYAELSTMAAKPA